MTELELRNKVVAIMEAWVGLKEKDGSFKPIIDLYNAKKPSYCTYKMKYTDHWCAATTSAAILKAGIEEVAPVECSCARMIERYKDIGRWEESDSHVPAPGDIVMYDWGDTGVGDNKGNPDHVGIVSKVTGSTITVIEGNMSETVGKRTLQVNGKYIRGYCLPDYAAMAAGKSVAKSSFKIMKVDMPILQKGAKGEPVAAMQTLLNLRSNAQLKVDSSFGPDTDKAFRSWQKSVGLTVDGSCGAQSWAALIGG